MLILQTQGTSGLKIGIVSDIHTKVDLYENALNFLVKRGVSALILAGDIVKKDALILTKECALDTFIVFGNNDAHLYPLSDEFNIKSEPYKFNIAQTSFKLMHMPFFLTPDSDVIIYGHTHIQDIKKTDTTLFLNPGEICAREKPKSECMELEILEDRYIVRAYSCTPYKNSWEEKYYEFCK